MPELDELTRRSKQTLISYRDQSVKTSPSPSPRSIARPKCRRSSPTPSASYPSMRKAPSNERHQPQRSPSLRHRTDM
jgi:hypothetical protein